MIAVVSIVQEERQELRGQPRARRKRWGGHRIQTQGGFLEAGLRPDDQNSPCYLELRTPPHPREGLAHLFPNILAKLTPLTPENLLALNIKVHIGSC